MTTGWSEQRYDLIKNEHTQHKIIEAQKNKLDMLCIWKIFECLHIENVDNKFDLISTTVAEAAYGEKNQENIWRRQKGL